MSSLSSGRQNRREDWARRSRSAPERQERRREPDCEERFLLSRRPDEDGGLPVDLEQTGSLYGIRPLKGAAFSTKASKKDLKSEEIKEGNEQKRSVVEKLRLSIPGEKSTVMNPLLQRLWPLAPDSGPSLLTLAPRSQLWPLLQRVTIRLNDSFSVRLTCCYWLAVIRYGPAAAEDTPEVRGQRSGPRQRLCCGSPTCWLLPLAW